MDKAKAAVSNFVSKSGHHDTTVQESVSPAVQQEKVMPTRHENIQKAVDREVHQDHYHTTVQPVHDREVRPEEHHHQMAPVQEKKISHGDHNGTRRQLEQEASQFKNTSTVHDTKHTQSAAPTVEGEHTHHHVHENIQPVIHKETITPEIVHTTVPVHETHHESAKHHDITVLPTKHMNDFTSAGGKVTGGTTTEHYYEGCPKPFNESSRNGNTGADGQPLLPTPQPIHNSDVKRTGLHEEPSHSGVRHGQIPSGVSQPARGTDPNCTGTGEPDTSQHHPETRTKKTIGASGMDDFPSRH